jgi:hypothetical protein
VRQAAAGLRARLASAGARATDVLVLHLGPPWAWRPLDAAFARLGCATAEAADVAWEQPPSAGVCPLDTLFGAASTAASWLAERRECLVVRVAGLACSP